MAWQVVFWLLVGLHVAAFVRALSHRSTLLAWRHLRRDVLTRVSHGIEHAAANELLEGSLDLGVLHGFTFGRRYFVLALFGAASADRVRSATERAIARLQRGETELAYTLGCGTALVVRAVGRWLGLAITMLAALLVGGGTPVWLLLLAIWFDVWRRLEDGLVMFVEETVTVSSDFRAALVRSVAEVRQAAGLQAPPNERWFLVELDVALAPSAGGAVAPGVF